MLARVRVQVGVGVGVEIWLKVQVCSRRERESKFCLLAMISSLNKMDQELESETPLFVW
jgi:hypothetical protein